MIDKRDVVRMKIPYPTVKDKLAYHTHMYICMEACQRHVEFVKAQTVKPYMLIDSPIDYFIDEAPDINRNPFRNLSRIDCEKIFMSDGLAYPDTLKTSVRPDVCQELFCEIIAKLNNEKLTRVPLDPWELQRLNPKIPYPQLF